MREEILALRAAEPLFTHQQIAGRLGCSLSTVKYHLIPGRREKESKRLLASKTTLMRKLDSFHTPRRAVKGLNNKVNMFCSQRSGSRRVANRQFTFTKAELIARLGDAPTCYLTGEALDLSSPQSFTFDHMIPVSRGGSCELANLGPCTPGANQAKADCTPEEFVALCRKVLEHAGFTVSEMAVL